MIFYHFYVRGYRIKPSILLETHQCSPCRSKKTATPYCRIFSHDFSFSPLHSLHTYIYRHFPIVFVGIYSNFKEPHWTNSLSFLDCTCSHLFISIDLHPYILTSCYCIYMFIFPLALHPNFCQPELWFSSTSPCVYTPFGFCTLTTCSHQQCTAV